MYSTFRPIRNCSPHHTHIFRPGKHNA